MSREILTLLAVHAHPDDEAISMGGVLARAAAEGIRTVLLCTTLGGCGALHDSDCDLEEAKRNLAAVREQELRRACAVLGLTDLYLLGYGDSGMAGAPDNADPRNFLNAPPNEACARVTLLMRQVRPQVVTYNAQGSYGHPDHIAAHRVTLAAVEAAADPLSFPELGVPPWQVQKLYYTVRPRGEITHLQAVLRRHGLAVPNRPGFKMSIAVPDELGTTRVDIRAYLDQKRAALRLHRSQLDPDNVLLTMPEHVAREAWGVESFQRVFAHVPVPAREDDLFVGLR